MPTKAELLQEAYNRGILPEHKRALYEEAVNRGLIKDATESTPKVTMRSGGPKGPVEGMGGMERFLAGMGKGFTDIWRGANQAVREVGEKVNLAKEGSADQYRKEVIEPENQLFAPLADASNVAKAGRFAGQVAGTAWIPGTASAKLLPRVLSGVAGGAAASGLMPTEKGESRVGNMLTGAGFGGATPVLFRTLGKGIGKVRGNNVADESQDLARVFKENKVHPHVSDLRSSPGLKNLDTVLEKVPMIGTRGSRSRQSQELLEAAQRMIRKVAGESVTDPGESIQASLGRVLNSSKTQAGKLYDAVEEAAAEATGRVQMRNTKDAISRLAQEEGILPDSFQDKTIVGLLSRFEGMDDLTFKSARKMRSRLAQEARKLRKQAVTGASSDEEVRAISILQSALDDDIADFAEREGGDVGDLFKKANVFYRESVVPLKDRALRKAGQEDFDTDRLVKVFVKNDRPKLAEKLYGALDNEGRVAVKWAVLDEAFQRATSNEKIPFSPAKFAGYIERLGKTKDVIFPGEESKMLNGFVKMSRAAERAGQFMENQPTGQRLLEPGMYLTAGYALSAYPVAAVAGLGSVFGLSRLLTSGPGRALLTRANGIPEKSPLWNRVLYQDLPRAMAVATTNPEQTEGQGPLLPAPLRQVQSAPGQ